MNNDKRDEVIEAFLLNQLSEQERQQVIDKIATDPVFKRSVKLHQLLRLGIQERIGREQIGVYENDTKHQPLRVAWKNPHLKRGIAVAVASVVLLFFGIRFLTKSDQMMDMPALLAPSESLNLGIAGESNPYLLSAQEAYNDQNWGEAIVAFDRYLENTPESNFEVMLHKGTALRLAGRLPEARTLLEYLIATESQHYSGNDARWQLALAYLEQERPDAAREQLSILAADENSLLKKKAGDLLRQMGKKQNK